MSSIEQITIQLRQHRAQSLDSVPKRHAAVALLLTAAESGPELLFIRRAEFTDDPWSGDVAFPGGGIEEQDGGPQQAAEREVGEEIGLQLNSQQCLGQLDDLAGAYLPVCVSSFVYLLPKKPALTLNEEVLNSFWVPLTVLQEASRNQEKTFAYRGNSHSHPIIELSDYCDRFLWGISYRILQSFFALTSVK